MMNERLKEVETPTEIERLFRESGLKPGFVAENVGISLEQFRAIRLGKSDPRGKVLAKLSEIFKVSVESLIHGKSTNIHRRCVWARPIRAIIGRKKYTGV
jgi:hypothetical protein